ncbi:unnamed protein product, partial [Ranitomeya imitator]
VSYAEQWGLESRDLPTVANLASLPSLSSSEIDAFLLMYNEKSHKRDHTSKNLQAGTPLGLLVHLYSRNAVVDGYVQQFFYTFRYFCCQEDLLQFLVDRINSTLPREDTDPSCMDAKIYHRSLVLLQAWIEECWHIDFSMNPDLLDKIEDLTNSQGCGVGKPNLRLLNFHDSDSTKMDHDSDSTALDLQTVTDIGNNSGDSALDPVLPRDERGDYLLSLLQELSCKKCTISSPTLSSERRDDTKSLHSLCTKFSEDNVSRKDRILQTFGCVLSFLRIIVTPCLQVYYYMLYVLDCTGGLYDGSGGLLGRSPSGFCNPHLQGRYLVIPSYIREILQGTCLRLS